MNVDNLLKPKIVSHWFFFHFLCNFEMPLSFPFLYKYLNYMEKNISDDTISFLTVLKRQITRTFWELNFLTYFNLTKICINLIRSKLPRNICIKSSIISCVSKIIWRTYESQCIINFIKLDNWRKSSCKCKILEYMCMLSLIMMFCCMPRYLLLLQLFNGVAFFMTYSLS
jgi:hypothetical protein